MTTIKRTWSANAITHMFIDLRSALDGTMPSIDAACNMSRQLSRIDTLDGFSWSLAILMHDFVFAL
jgi:hypothetical protein